jgi:hypothetical protein
LNWLKWLKTHGYVVVDEGEDEDDDKKKGKKNRVSEMMK